MFFGQDFPRIDDPLQGIVFSSETTLFLGKGRNKMWYLDVVLKMNIRQ